MTKEATKEQLTEILRWKRRLEEDVAIAWGAGWEAFQEALMNVQGDAAELLRLIEEEYELVEPR